MAKRVVLVSSFCLAAAVAGALATSVRVAQSRSADHAASVPPATASARPRAVIRAEGRVVAGRAGQVTVGAELAGTVDTVLVEEGSVVRAGEPLAIFRVPEQMAAVREANAHAREAAAQAQSLDEETQRTKTLVESGALPRQALSQLAHQRDAARARRAAAGAASARLSALASHARVVAPIAGTVVLRKIEAGESVVAGAPLFVIADLSKLRVEAEVDEFDAPRVHPAMKARVTVDGVDGAALAGNVTEVGLVIAPRGIRPQDPARPLDAQVLKVKVGLDAPSALLRLGQRVNVTLGDADGV